MELTENFLQGLSDSRDQLADDNHLTEKDDRLVRRFLRTNRTNKLFVHKLIRDYFIRTEAARGNRIRPLAKIDWTKLVAWIKEHWLDILKIILMVIPLI